MSENTKRAAGNRRHVTTACLACRDDKIKCDGKNPVCRQCSAKNRRCVYVGVDKRKISVRKTVEAFAHRLRQLEAFIITNNLEVPAPLDEHASTLDGLMSAYAANSPSSETLQDFTEDSIDAIQPPLCSVAAATSSGVPIPVGRDNDLECPGDSQNPPWPLHQSNTNGDANAVESCNFQSVSVDSGFGSFPFNSTVDPDWVWNFSTGQSFPTEPDMSTLYPSSFMPIKFPLSPQDTVNLSHDLSTPSLLVDEESTDDEDHLEVTNEFSARLGSLLTTLTGDFRYYGATSNLNLAQGRVFSEKSQSVSGRALQTQARLEAAGVGHAVPDDLTQHLVNLYFSWHDPSLHVVDKHTFETAREKYIQEKHESTFFSDVLVNAMCAVGAAFETARHPTYPSPLGEFFANRCKALLDLDLDSPRIATVQALAILSSHEAACMRDSRGWLFSGMSMRLAFDFGLHISPKPYVESGIMSIEEANVRSITFWGSFATDRMWGLYLGRPFSNSFDAITVEKPTCLHQDNPTGGWTEYTTTKENSQYSIVPNPQELLTERWIKLYEIMSPLGHSLYFQVNASKSKLQALAQDTFERLQEWKSELPQDLVIDIDNPGTKRHLPHLLMLHMQYALFVIILHRPFVSKHYIQPSPLVGSGHVHARKMCVSSAVDIAKLLHLYEQEHSLRRANIQMVHVAFTAALILVYATISENDPHNHRELSVHTETCCYALAELGHVFENASRTLDVLLSVKRMWQARLVATAGTKRNGPSLESKIRIRARSGTGVGDDV